MSHGRTDWNEAALFMRKHAATHATWDSAGNLLSLTLTEHAPIEPKQETQAPAPERDVKRRIEYAASGRPVPRAGS